MLIRKATFGGFDAGNYEGPTGQEEFCCHSYQVQGNQIVFKISGGSTRREPILPNVEFSYFSGNDWQTISTSPEDQPRRNS
jgi:hypothetical protein